MPPQLLPLVDQVLTAVRSALASATHDVFIYAAGVVMIAVVASVFLKDVPLRGHTPREVQEIRDAEAREEVPAFGK